MANDEGSWSEEIKGWMCCYRRSRKPTIGRPRLTMTSNPHLAMYINNPTIGCGATPSKLRTIPMGSSSVAQKAGNGNGIDGQAEPVAEGHPSRHKDTNDRPEEKTAKTTVSDNSPAENHVPNTVGTAK